MEEYDDDVISSELALHLLAALLMFGLILATLTGACLFIVAGSIPALLAALLAGHTAARMVE